MPPSPSGGATGSAFFHGRGDEYLQSFRQLSKLPNLLVIARATRGRYGLRTVDQHAQAVICSVGRRHRMASGSRDRDSHLMRTLARSGMRGDRRTLGDASPDLTSGPRTAYLDGLSQPHITAMTLEQRQQLFRAVSGPSGKKTVICQRQEAAAMSSNKSSVTHLPSLYRRTLELISGGQSAHPRHWALSAV